MSLVHLTGEGRWLDEASAHIKGGWSFLASLPDDLQQRIRDELVEFSRALPPADGSLRRYPTNCSPA